MKITIDGKEIKQVTEFCYLGSLISDDAKCHTEIKKRIAMGKEAFTKRKELLKEELNRGINKRMDKDLDDEKRGRQTDRCFRYVDCGYGGGWRGSARQDTERMKKY